MNTNPKSTPHPTLSPIEAERVRAARRRLLKAASFVLLLAFGPFVVSLIWRLME